MTVAELIAHFLRSSARRVTYDDITQGAHDNYRESLQSFAAQFGAKDVSACRQHDLTEFLDTHPGWKALSTKRTRISAVLAAFRWAVDEELIEVCPYKSPRSLRGQIAETRRPATREEFEALMDVGSEPLRRALLFLFLTGCRTCEMRELIWAWVHIDGPAQPHLALMRHKNIKRTGRPRYVGLDAHGVELLREIKATSKSEHVFTNCDGFPWRKDAFCHHFRRAARRVGLDDGKILDRVTAYCLRHTYACDGIEAGFTEDQVAHQLGNSPDIVRRVYSRKLGQKVSFVSDIANGIGKDRKQA